MRLGKIKKVIAGTMVGIMLFTLPVFATPVEGEGVQEDILVTETETEQGVLEDTETTDVDVQDEEAEVNVVTESEEESSPEISVFSAPGVPAEFVGWTEVTAGTIISNQFTRGGVSYTATTNLRNTLFVANKIVNEDTGEENTYVYSNGGGSTSRFYYRSDANTSGTSISIESTRYFTKTTGSMTTVGKYGETSNGKLAVIDIFDVTSAGIMNHHVTIKNIGSDTYTNFVAGAQIDTELNRNDSIPVYAIGNGGFYITDANITLYSEPLTNATAYAIRYNRFTDAGTSAASASYQTELLSGVDTAVNWEVPLRSSFAPGESVSFSWKESVFVAGETVSTVEAIYEDAGGNTLQASSTITGMTGETYTLTPPSIPNYEVIDVIGNATGTFTDSAQTVRFVYGRTLPAGKGGYIIQYLDEAGNEIKVSETLIEDTGTQQTIEPPVIEGYEFVEADANLDITFTAQYETLVLTYREIPVVAENPPVNENNTTISGKQNMAPKTGDEFSMLRNGLMLALSLSTVVIVSVIKRKKAISRSQGEISEIKK